MNEDMLEYLAARDRAHAEELEEFKSRFTPRELSLMRDVAVMGFAQGVRYRDTGSYPKDSAVFDLVMGLIPYNAASYPCASGVCHQYSSIHPEGSSS